MTWKEDTLADGRPDRHDDGFIFKSLDPRNKRSSGRLQTPTSLCKQTQPTVVPGEVGLWPRCYTTDGKNAVCRDAQWHLEDGDAVGLSTDL